VFKLLRRLIIGRKTRRGHLSRISDIEMANLRQDVWQTQQTLNSLVELTGHRQIKNVVMTTKDAEKYNGQEDYCL